ncbi:uncharacterized protein SOCE26_104430 [Sorangium cellulosum]|uniref:Uncharacterized protein n=1 Tax=Sorangium cellulosum TaxID=56 RepID=A0A2L0FBD6_SORCE|nr:hypothetical protein [Sorangium cellulosum]AUX48900.1 uncharacterized protein SOCE26_104430 [Sorangium cellulosum]
MLKEWVKVVVMIAGGTVLGVGCGAEAPSGGEALDESQAALQFTCGGITGRGCPGTNRCVDDPNDDCNPKRDADCGGICVGDPCGGFAGFACDRGYVCVDDPRDTCDPDNGGADCPGMCLHAGEIE